MSPAQAVRYRVAMPRPHSHLFEVEACFPAGRGALDARLPVWAPGSYLVREFARQVQEVSAADAEGRPLAVRRTDKRTFHVEAHGRPVTLRYRVYAHELSVRTSHLDGTHGYFNGANLFLYTEPTRAREHRVRVDAPAGWSAHSALARQGELFVARDYDELVDSPFEVGPGAPLPFQVAGVPHALLVWGDEVPDAQRLVDELQRVCEEAARLFGGLPLERYLFLVHLAERGRGGLEHQASSTLLFPRTGLASARGREDFLTLAAHEYFHLWLVKRVRPRAHVPLDYGQEQYTRLLWFFEGGTAYYDNILVRRAGLMSAGRHLGRLGETLSLLHATPGRRVQTLQDASLLAWVKHYRPDEHSPNSAVSYYVKGEVVCALLDLHIRRASAGARSLDDLVRLLWERYGTDSGVPEEALEAHASEVAGADLSAFFERALRSCEELDYSAFSHVGLEVRLRAREGPGDKGGSAARARANGRPRAWLGATVRGASSLTAVLEGSPAHAAGLYANDEVVALDGWRVDAPGLLARCEERQPGEQVRVTVFRRGRLLDVPVVLGSRPLDAAYLARLEQPSDAQKAAFQAWLGVAWDELSG